MRKEVLCFFIFIGCLCHANPVDESKARQVAMQFLNAQVTDDGVLRSRGRNADNLYLAYTQKGDAGNVFYVFNQSADQGFVIVSADDQSVPILGYADRGSFDQSKLPEGLKDLFGNYEKQISYAAKSSAVNTRGSKGWKVVKPLIQTQWDQYSPYNKLCPFDENAGERSITGCGAVAFAQLMFYHRFPDKGRNSISYEWNGKTLAADFSQVTFEWDKMKLTYDGDTPDTDDAIATLMYNCALSMQAFFGAYSTYSWFTNQTLSKYFGYKDQINYITKENVGDNEFENLIYQDLIKGLPVICTCIGQNDWSHLFLIDGCDSDGFFHMNFGWSGHNDGYYTLSPINLDWIQIDTFTSILNNIEPDISGKWFARTEDNRFFAMDGIGDIVPDPDNATDLLLLDLKGDKLASGFKSVTLVHSDGSQPMSFMVGDANRDGVTDAADIVKVAKCITDKTTNWLEFLSADVNNDGDVDSEDIMSLVSIIMKRTK